MICKTATGRELTVSLMIEGSQFPVLMIFTGEEPGLVFHVFNDPAETAELTELRDDGSSRVFHGYTHLQSISPTTVATGEPELMVWLDRQPQIINTEEAHT